MRQPVLKGAMLGAVVLAGAMPAPASAAKRLLRLSEGGVPVAQGAEVGYRLVLKPEGFQGSALQIGGGPLVNEATKDGFTTNEGGAGTGGWEIHGTIEAITLQSDGKATIVASGEAIANDEPEGVEPTPPPHAFAVNKWECFYPLPKKLKGTFSTAGTAVVSGNTTAKASKLCHLPGFHVSFLLELLPEGRSSPPLETSLIA